MHWGQSTFRARLKLGTCRIQILIVMRVFEIFTAVLLSTPFFWDKTSHHQVSSSRIFEVLPSLSTGPEVRDLGLLEPWRCELMPWANLSPPPAFRRSDWPIYLKTSHITDKIYFRITLTSNAVTLKMDAIHSSRMSQYLTAIRCRNLKHCNCLQDDLVTATYDHLGDFFWSPADWVGTQTHLALA
jgi:hypothetical protein